MMLPHRRLAPRGRACLPLLAAGAAALVLATALTGPGAARQLARAQAVAVDDDQMNRFEASQSTSIPPSRLRGGGQGLSCLGGGFGPSVLIPDEPVPVPTTVAPKSSPSGIGFFKDVGRKANSLLKFGGMNKLGVDIKSKYDEVKLGGSYSHSFVDDKSGNDKVSVKGEGVRGQYGYWLGADSSSKLEGGVAAKKDLGDGQKLDLYLSAPLTKLESVEAEAVYSSPKLNASARAPGISLSSPGILEASGAYAVNEDLKVAGALALDPSKVSMASLKTGSAIGAQYTTPDYTISGTTEGFGTSTKATISSSFGKKDIAFSATMAGLGKNLAFSTGLKTEILDGVTARAGISTTGDMDVELSKKVMHHIGVKVGASTNMNSLTKPKLGAQISIEA